MLWTLFWAALAVTGCATTQAQRNTTLMAATISRMRQDQALNNIAAAIDDRSAVPSAIVLGTGQASITTTPSPAVKAILDHPGSLELGVAGNYTVTAQWQFTSITDPDDLRRLRNIFALIVSTDAQFDELEEYFHGAPGAAPSARGEAVYRNLLGEPALSPGAKSAAPQPDGAQAPHAPSPEAAGQVISWRQARRFIDEGDSIDCRLYQRGKPPAARGVPFRRWLFWRRRGGTWSPAPPPDGVPMELLGAYGKWELGVTSRACLDDFVILIQALTPNTSGSAAEGPKYMLQ
jgi:hypothetical protein